MDRGGAETWIVNVMRQIDRELFQFDFLVEGTMPGALDDEIRALGGRIFPVGSHRRPLAFVRNVRRAMKENGPYDVMHSHVHYFSGVMLTLAKSQRIPVRIAHSHNDLRRVS